MCLTVDDVRLRLAGAPPLTSPFIRSSEVLNVAAMPGDWGGTAMKDTVFRRRDRAMQGTVFRRRDRAMQGTVFAAVEAVAARSKGAVVSLPEGTP